MITQKDKQELAIFIPIVIAVTVAIGGEALLAYLSSEIHALRSIVVGLLCGFILLMRQVIRLEREVRKLRQPDSKGTV
jgi:ABC-type siderophore export system fused ATPase/permease subunit